MTGSFYNAKQVADLIHDPDFDDNVNDDLMSADSSDDDEVTDTTTTADFDIA